MKMSQAEAMASKLGYELIFTLNGKKRKQRADKLVMELEGIVGDDAKLQRLAFLQIAMKLNGIERKVLAQQLGLNYTGVNRWFKVDDISISYLFRIAELYNLKVDVNFQRLKSSNKTD